MSAWWLLLLVPTFVFGAVVGMLGTLFFMEMLLGVADWMKGEKSNLHSAHDGYNKEGKEQL